MTHPHTEALRWTAAALQALANGNLSERSTFTVEGVKKPLSEILDMADAALAQPQHQAATPSSHWRAEGKADPHAKLYDCERARLTLGSLTDDELANGAFLNYDRPMDFTRVLAEDPDYHAPIVWMTAVKDRIRWLSRALGRAQQAHPAEQHEGRDASDLYYLQDSRSYVGNCPMWWAANGNGYTTRLDRAHRYTLDQAMRQHRSRPTDVPWPCIHMDAIRRPTVDIQEMGDVGVQVAALIAMTGGNGNA